MLSNKNVVDVVNEAIDEGEIEVGGLPEIGAGDAGKALVVNSGETGVEWAEVGAPDNVLVLPDEAPAAQQLVGISTSNTQNSLGIGEGLEINHGELGVNIGDGLEISDTAISMKRHGMSFGTARLPSSITCGANTTTRVTASSVSLATGVPAIYGITSFAYPYPNTIFQEINSAGLVFCGICSYMEGTSLKWGMLIYNPTSSDVTFSPQLRDIAINYC